jgi:hypothetical protein
MPDVDLDLLAALCRRRQVVRLVAPDGLDSPAPVLCVVVEFLPRTGYGAYLMARFEQELTELLGRPVDLLAIDQVPDTERRSLGNCASVFDHGGG